MPVFGPGPVRYAAYHGQEVWLVSGVRANPVLLASVENCRPLKGAAAPRRIAARDVGVKVLSPDRGDARQFAQEARAIASLSRPNILSIYDVGEDCLVAELIEGTVLRGQSFPGRKALDVYTGKGVLLRS